MPEEPKGFTSVKRVGPTHQVREQLLAAIERGDYPPDSMLPSERVLSETFGVSRVTVRGALVGLQSTGLIRIEHGRGAFVEDPLGQAYLRPIAQYLQVHRAELVELLKVRGVLDELAAVEAIAQATDEGIEELRGAEVAFADAARSNKADIDEVSRLDVEFHVCIAGLTNGKLLHGLLSDLNSILKESRRVTFSRPGQLQRSVIEHHAIVQAIQARDVEGAHAAVRQHVQQLQQWVHDVPLDRDPMLADEAP